MADKLVRTGVPSLVRGEMVTSVPVSTGKMGPHSRSPPQIGFEFVKSNAAWYDEWSAQTAKRRNVEQDDENPTISRVLSWFHCRIVFLFTGATSLAYIDYDYCDATDSKLQQILLCHQ